MAGKIPNHFIQDLLARTDLVDLIDARVPLKRSGSNFTARCPFHTEKTPSFSVNREKQFFYCFGCGARGNAIGFLMDFDRLSFPEAVETLADSLGLPVPHEDGSTANHADAAGKIQPLYDIQEEACRFYQQQLKSHPASQQAVAYLRQRGVSGEIARDYRLGYASPESRNLPADWPQEPLVGSGLLVKRDSGRLHDWFRDRIVFPIRDRRGRVVGFGGRIMGEGAPKYLNSAETEVFRKHREVYGLYELLQTIRKPDAILVVEGYMDVIAMAQFGIRNAVATLGTATSSDQVSLLFRYTSSLVFCFDGDAAGRSAAWKALESSLPHIREGRQVRFLMLPESHDPDSLVREEGVDAFRQRVREAVAFSDYFFDHLSTTLDLGTIEGRAALVNQAQPLIQRLPEGVFRDMIEQKLANLSGQAAKDPYAATQTSQRYPTANRSKRVPGRPSALRTFMALLLQNPDLVEWIDSSDAARLAAIEGQGALLMEVIELLREHPDITPGMVLEMFREHPQTAIIGKLMTLNLQVLDENRLDAFRDYLRHITGQQLRENRLEQLIEIARSGKLSTEEQDELRQLTDHSVAE